MKTLKNENTTGVNETGRKANTPLRYLTAKSLIGNKVYNKEDEELGDIKDIMLNIHDGKIEYMIIEFGGFLGIGEKLFAVPFQALALDTDRHAFILNQEREVLKNAPGFDKDHWPETNAVEKTHAYWGSFMGQSTGAEY